ncbi:CbtA family protein [Agrobacterium sp. NPDC090273]|uniref:CbtA family protein n=1 Tax=Agrobacterium sp. NPDC090273 TaxID=3363919 RepID=UPI00383ADD1D
MAGQLLLRGMIVGLIAGILAFGFARYFGEPLVDQAIAFEEQQSEAAGLVAEPEVISRATQAGLGLFTGIVAFSTAVGGIFALAFAFAHGRLGSLGPRATSGVLALAAFISLVTVPMLKYPANPPAVGSAETIGARTELFFVMIVASVFGMVLAILAARSLYARFGGFRAIVVSGLFYAAFVTIALSLLPSVNEVPENFSTSLLWGFRAVSLAIHFIVWLTIGGLFGWLAERILVQQSVPASVYNR